MFKLARNVRTLVRSNLFVRKEINITSKVINDFQLQVSGTPCFRNLFSKESLNIDVFDKQRERTRAQMDNVEDKFREKMKEYVNEESTNMIFTEDLKNMIHLAKSDDDVDLVVSMMKRFNKQNKQLRFGNFMFGPVVMRLFYVLNKPELALQCFLSEELDGFFDQLASYHILCDLLYENKNYQEVLDVFKIIQERQVEGARYPKNVIILAFAACYKLNTEQSLDYALKLWRQLAELGHIPVRRAVTFCAGLALNQNRSNVALEMVCSSRNQGYTTVRNLKVAALADMGRIEDALPVMKSILTEDAPTHTPHTFNNDVVEKLKAAVLKADNPDITLEFNRLEQLFRKQGHISETTLDEQLCVEIQRPVTVHQRTEFGLNRTSRYEMSENQYRNQSDNRTRNQPNYRRRPGLNELN